MEIGGGAARMDPAAWKTQIGTKPVNARLSLLPDTKIRKGAIGTSLIMEIALAAFVLMLPLFFPKKLIPKAMYMVTEIPMPSTHVPPPPVRKRPEVRPKIERARVEQPKPKVDMAKLFAPRIEAPKLKPRKRMEANLPKVDATFKPLKLEVADNDQPVRPRAPVKTGVLTSGSSAPATIERAVALSKVQTGGFGDPRGLPGPGNPNKRANINHFGSPALPAGLGYGNGTGGAKGIRGTVASAGFGDGVAIPPSGRRRRAGTLEQANFSDKNKLAAKAPRKKAVAEQPAVQPVVILAKPRPKYTPEALKLRIEGDVVLGVVFPASGGPVHVNRVVKGLGHGLDESAIRAAEQIRFKPAISNGHAVDFPAIIHIVFQMAY